MDVVFQHLRVLIRCMRLLGIFGVQRRRSTVDNPYASVGAVKIKFVIFFSATVLGSAYTIVITLLVYNVSFTERFDIYPIVMTTHIVTLCVVLCILPWQTYGRNTHLAAILNVFHRNEKDLIAFTGSASNYGRAGRLATVIVWNGVLFHVFFHTYYIFETYNFAHGLFPFYLVCCLIMYEDLATEYLLGLCDCFLLIARIQLERLVSIARHSEIEDHQRELRVLFYVDMNNRICCMLRDNLCPYFGPIILTFCAYVCLEAAVCILDLFDVFSAGNNSILQMLANVLWPLSNLKKLIILLLYVEQLNAMVEETALCTRHFDDYRLQNTRAAKQIQKFLLKNLHQKKKFSACGFFDIDNTVIYMVFSSIVTYLVILIQFKQLETDLTQSEGVFNVTSNLTTPGPS
uniref:Gustatory receptor n=1 Tax=Anopheles dirus TaxID=7168 RepID=A0A182NBW7_9DIPT